MNPKKYKLIRPHKAGYIVLWWWNMGNVFSRS